MLKCNIVALPTCERHFSVKIKIFEHFAVGYILAFHGRMRSTSGILCTPDLNTQNTKMFLLTLVKTITSYCQNCIV